MSNFGAAAAASTFTAVTVLERKTLHTGPIVKLRVPANATVGSYPTVDGKQVPFLQFSYNIRGGRVNIFVHTNDISLCGKLVTAVASVMHKLLEDDREFLYVDLHPVEIPQTPTHKLAVMSDTGGSWESEGHLTFKTPGSLQGVIIFAPPEAKIVPTDTVAVMLTRTAEAPVETKRSVTGDTQLDRLLTDGWQIESEDTVRVMLFKMKGDIRKTMTHYRPKHTRS